MLTFIQQTDKGLVTPFKDRDTKLYAFNPPHLPLSGSQLGVDVRVNYEQNGHAPTPTIFYSPVSTSTLGYMSAYGGVSKDSTTLLSSTKYVSALDRVESQSTNVVGSGDAEKPFVCSKTGLTNPNTSTPKNTRSKNRGSLSNPYRLSYTCSECLREIADGRMISQGGFGRTLCHDCSKVRGTKIHLIFRLILYYNFSFFQFSFPIITVSKQMIKHNIFVIFAAYDLSPSLSSYPQLSSSVLIAVVLIIYL